MTEIIEITVPSFPGYKYTGEYRMAQPGEIFISAFDRDTIQRMEGGESPAKVLIVEEIKNERK